MTASPSNVPLEPERLTIPRARMRWKWALTALAILLAYGMYECGIALYHGRALSNAAVRHFHSQLNDAQFDAICDEADEAFFNQAKKEEVLKFFAAVHRKLGEAEDASLLNINVNAQTSGTYVTTTYTTKFAHGTATETFTWKKTGDTLRLYGYNIQSNALIVD